MKYRSKKGFTLAELLIVVAIINVTREYIRDCNRCVLRMK